MSPHATFLITILFSPGSKLGTNTRGSRFLPPPRIVVNHVVANDPTSGCHSNNNNKKMADFFLKCIYHPNEILKFYELLTFQKYNFPCLVTPTLWTRPQATPTRLESVPSTGVSNFIGRNVLPPQMYSSGFCVTVAPCSKHSDW